MNAQRIDAVPDLAHLALADRGAIGVAPVGAVGGVAAGVTGARQHGERDQATLRNLATLQASLVRKGFELNPTSTGIYIVMRCNLARTLATLDDVQDFAQQVGVAP